MRTIRQRVRDARCDVQGIALQTVVIMVVLLVIAGSVAAVLVSRGAEVTGQLEETGIGAISETTCPITKVGAANGQASTGNLEITGTTPTLTAGGNTPMCVWVAEGITPAQCFAAAGGTLFEAVATANPEGITAATSAKGCAVELA
ncbi:MAG: hypothetical protein F4111_05965 [Acidimicrobiales bacterium]|nr:hypothetical protein [Acidimicrobiales bacterium]